MKLYVVLLCLVHQFLHYLRSLFVEQRTTDLHAVQHLQESERHAAADNHLIHLVQQVLNELNLIGHLCSTQNSQERIRWVVQCLTEIAQLFVQQQTSRSLSETLAQH